ncbi:hypothetical protein DH2020_023402 [Rehmannia glutinosa]|uniref:DUF4283 domain-containing protein n=1 Tax=Rehmannia glutinosa TaxID=99300 RepID=A0ABR0W9S6_REHGL
MGQTKIAGPFAYKNEEGHGKTIRLTHMAKSKQKRRLSIGGNDGGEAKGSFGSKWLKGGKSADKTAGKQGEDEGFILEEGENESTKEDFELCLLGHFLTDRSINFLIMKNRLANVWRPNRRINIREIGNQRFLFRFFHVADLKRVLDEGPWFFDNYLLILHRIKTGDVPSSLPLFSVPFWIQIYDLPVGYMRENVGKQLENFVGNFLEYDGNNNSAIWRTYMRIMVEIDVRIPLKRFKKIRCQAGDWTIIKFKYGRLGVFCFICGLMGHGE